MAFAQIRMGMGEEELFRLMAPYKKRFSEHAQWPAWTDGEFVVSVTVWSFEPVSGRPLGVTDKEIKKKRGHR
jgi:hypothetical protein